MDGKTNEMPKDEYLKLLGLLLLAKDHAKQQAAIQASISSLLDLTDTDPSDWISDCVYGDQDADLLLKRVGLTAPRIILT